MAKLMTVVTRTNRILAIDKEPGILDTFTSSIEIRVMDELWVLVYNRDSRYIDDRPHFGEER